MYAFHLDNERRILSVTYDRYASQDDVIMETMPEGNVTDYKIINDEFVYDPLPIPVTPPEISILERINDIESALCEIVDRLG